MTKLKKLFMVLASATVLAFMLITPVITVFADTDESISEPPPAILEEEREEGNIKDLVNKFTEFMKAQYGDNYEYYYDRIIENWGSVEAYLLSFGEKLPEEQKNDWDIFVTWLGDYAPVWAPPLAVVVVIIVAVLGKKQFEKILEKVASKMVTPIIKELNLQSKAQVSTIHSQKVLLGNNPKFAATVAELETSERELTKNE